MAHLLTRIAQQLFCYKETQDPGCGGPPDLRVLGPFTEFSQITIIGDKNISDHGLLCKYSRDFYGRGLGASLRDE